MTKTEWNKIKRTVERKGFAILSDGALVGQKQCLYGVEYKAVDKNGQVITIAPFIDDLKFLFDD